MSNEELKELIAKHLIEFYRRRLQKIQGLRLKQVLRRKNPYLYKAIGTQSATEIVEGLLAAYLSSSEETLFGDAFFEPIAKIVSGGVVSPSEGVDIAIDTETKYKAISVKSGPNPFNSSQSRKQDDQFRSLMHRLQKLGKQFDPILGHAYGRLPPTKTSSTKYIYRRSAGQAFWEEITGDSDFYIKLIQYMEAEVIIRHREEYRAAWEKAVNKYLGEFIAQFCNDDGSIDWEKLVRFNSGKHQDTISKKVKTTKSTVRLFIYSFTRFSGDLHEHFTNQLPASNIKDALIKIIAELSGVSMETDDEVRAYSKSFIEKSLKKKRWTVEEFLRARAELWPDSTTLYILTDIREATSTL